MRTSRDAIRSLARYMAEAFGDDWEVGFYSSQGTFTRPGIAVRETGPLLSAGSRHTIDQTQPMAVYAYPSDEGSQEEIFDRVHEARETLWQAFNVGIAEGHPFRVPLYDYEGVPLNEGSTLRRYPDYLKVVDLAIEANQAPEDEKKWSIYAGLRLTWRRAGELEPGTRLAQRLAVDFTTP